MSIKVKIDNNISDTWFTWEEILQNPGMYYTYNDELYRTVYLLVPGKHDRDMIHRQVTILNGTFPVGIAKASFYKNLQFRPYYGTVTITNSRD